jgi:DNA-binding NtrC family response regulator
MKILIIDDDPAVREYLKEALSLEGHSVVSFVNGYDAIDYIKEHDVGLAYIDVKLPGIDGFETLKKIREIDPKVSGVMISGNMVGDFVEGDVKDGVYVSLSKPFTVEQLEEINKAYEKISDPIKFIYENPYGLDNEEIVNAKILVADDEEGIRDIVRDCLESEGFNNIEMSVDGSEAVKAFNRHKHDVVIVDIVMPNLSGIGVLRHVKAINESSQVIIITANADKDTAISAVKLGAYDYIEKPFDLDALTRIVKRAVEKKLLLDRESDKK